MSTIDIIADDTHSRPAPDRSATAAPASLARTLRDAAAAAAPDAVEGLERHGDLTVATAALQELALEVGLLRGFTEKARIHATTRTRPWPASGYTRGADDPHLLRSFGILLSSIAALDDLFEDAIASIDTAPGDAIPREITIARNFAAYLGRHEINRIIEVLGASTVSEVLGFHLYWQFFADRRATYRTLPSFRSSVINRS